jgi:hypothetical protein
MLTCDFMGYVNFVMLVIILYVLYQIVVILIYYKTVAEDIEAFLVMFS